MYVYWRNNLFPICVGLLLGIAVLLAFSLPRKWVFVLIGGLLFGVALIVAGNRWKRLLLFSMFLMTSINVDTYFFIFYEHIGGASGLRVSASFIMLILLCIPWIYEVVREKEKINIIRWVTLPQISYLVIALIFSFSTPEPLLGIYQVIQLLQAYLIFLYLSNKFSPKDDFYLVLYAVAIALVLQGTLTIAQRYTALPLNFRLFGGAEETVFEMVAGEAAMRPSGFFFHPILLADFVVLSLPLVIVLALFAPRRLLRLGAVISVLLGLVALVLTLSRGAWIGIGIALTCFTLFLARLKIVSRSMLARFVGIGICLMVLVLAFKGKDIYLRFTESLEGPVAVRFELVQIALEMFEEHPLVGVGINNFTCVVSDYERLTEFVAGFRHPVHNLYLLELSETGCLGSFLFLLFLYGIFRIGLSAMRQSSPRLRCMSAAIVSSFLAYLVMAMADWGYRLPAINTIFWTNLGILGALYLRSCREERYTGEGMETQVK